ncbi:MAG: cytochrome c [Bacteroidetes bacterium]|nr:cytochrome c [Bacteroidota bacterium]
MRKTNIKLILTVIVLSSVLFFTTRCSSDNTNNNATDNAASASTEPFDTLKDIGVGPVTATMTLGAIDNALADSGSKIFTAKCIACHAIEKKIIGPALSGVSKRRAPEWIMNQILNPSEMAEKDPIAKDLLGRYIAQMANQNLTQDEAREVLEFFRRNDNK